MAAAKKGKINIFIKTYEELVDVYGIDVLVEAVGKGLAVGLLVCIYELNSKRNKISTNN